MNASGAAIDPARELAAARRLDVPEPGPRARGLVLASVIRLRIIEVMVYERNPRRVSHERMREQEVRQFRFEEVRVLICTWLAVFRLGRQ